MAHVRARKRYIPRVTAPGRWHGWGREAFSAINGVRYPRELMVEQRGGLVSARPQDQQIDLIDGPIDLNTMVSPPVLPLPISRLTVVLPALGVKSGARAALFLLGIGSAASSSSSTSSIARPISLLSLDQPAVEAITLPVPTDISFVGGEWTVAERDVLARSGYVWVTAGYGYPLGTEEPGLIPVYRLRNATTGDYQITASAAERAAAIAAGYTDQGINFYAFPVTATAHNRKPLLRAVNGDGYHWYTGDAVEYKALSPSFTREGAIAQVLTGREGTYS